MTGFVLKSNHLGLKPLLHLAHALALISFCTSHTTYTISPTCPGNDTGHGDGTQCLTLSDVAKEPDIYFTTNTTLVFQPGNHSLQETIVPVASINNFTITSSSISNESDSRILCNASSFSFISVSDLQIDSISFVSCPLRLNLTTGRLKSCWFADSYGGAVAVYNGSSLYFSGESGFSSNEAIRGGAMVIDSSNLTFLGNSTFSNNKAVEYGGGLYISNHSVVTVKGSAVFMNNSARYNGSAVHAFYNNTIIFNGTSVFYNNTAGKFGGGLYFYDSNIANFIGNNSFCNNTANGQNGGALYAESNNTVKFIGSSVFCNNYAGYRGGAVNCRRNNKLSFEESCTFHSNRAHSSGGAVYAYHYNTVNFSGASGFYNSTSGCAGGALSVQDSNIANINGNTSFHYNTAIWGGAVFGHDNNIMNFGGNSTFLYGIAVNSGGAVYANYNNSVRLSGTSTFYSNIAQHYFGGALFAYTTNFVNISGTSTFHYNRAQHGGAVSTFFNNTESFDGLSAFCNNTAVINGGAVHSGVYNIMHFSSNTSFTGNRAKLLGGGLYAGSDTSVHVIGGINFMWNRASYGGGIFVQSGSISINTTCVTLSNNIAIFSGNFASESGGAMHTRSGKVSLNGSILVTGNTAKLGGGLAMSGYDGVLFLQPMTQMNISGNKATSMGGAIHIEDNPLTYCSLRNSLNTDAGQACFFQLYQEECVYTSEDLSSRAYTGGAQLIFLNNTANDSGSAIYGGSLEDCGVCFPKSGSWHQETSYQLGKNILQNLADEQNITGLDIASDPYKVCVCKGNISDCSSRTTNVTYYPGETLSIRVVATGQMNGTVPSVIKAVSKGIQLTSVYTTQTSNRDCTELHYPLLTSSEGQHVSLELYSNAPCSTSGLGYTLNIYIIPCPTGFAISDQGNCSCADRLRKYTQECNITSQTITRLQGSTFWVGLDYHNNSASELILHPHCPFDYCTEETVHFPLNETDTQCSNRRSGVLCGACQTGYSLALGSSRCIPDCSNLYVALLLLFAAAGLLLVLLLFFCNLTVAEGSISGLIFYANMLAVNPSVFMPPSDDRRKFLSVFIAWLNLDFGIETCFFTGLDTYSRAWLQFAFPLYIWLLVGMIVYLARVSTTAAKLLATTNPVAVLATLLLLSYTKLLRTIMAAFSFATLSYPEEETKVVWLYDGNIGYWDGKHLALLLASLLIFVLFFIPYTLFLLCGQWIQRNVQLRCVYRAMFCMKYFCDVYSAPYKARQSYWTGLLLLARFIVLLISTIVNIGSPQDPHTNLLVLIIVVSLLVVMAWISHGVYRKRYLDLLEASFLFNLVVLSVGTYQIHLSGSKQAALVNTSMIIAFITFIVIIAATLLRHLKKTRLGSQLFLQQLCYPNYRALEDQQEEPKEPCQAPPVPTASIVDIDRNRMSDFAECRNAEHHGLY